jgi:hypothetical protein
MQINRDTFFISVVVWEEPCPETQQSSRVIPSDWLDFDHLCAEITKDQPTGGAHHHVRELNHPNTREG